MTVELFDVRDADRLADALRLRLEVFVEEQGVPIAEEVDDHDRDDPGAVHALIRDGRAPVGTGRFYPLDPVTVKLGRMAVRGDARGRG
ncbi:MAG: GNAT family N-acetyltransferase, partial [Candidatus Eremiobacteraeota bacterium]|nr:GNAT family N-acetyltransferase [Candidatus Eremiobacteraeota bacterium]